MILILKFLFTVRVRVFQLQLTHSRIKEIDASHTIYPDIY